MKNTNFLLAIFAMFILFFGCINLDVDQQPEEEDDSEKQTLNPSFNILYPANSAEIESSTSSMDLEILLTTSQLYLTSPSSQNVHGQGYFILKLDNSVSGAVLDNFYKFENVELGQHTLIVEFVNNDGSSYTPKISKTITFSIKLKEESHISDTYTVILENGVFTPNTLSIKKGDILLITNNEIMPHAFKISNLENSPPLKKGETFEVVFSDSGEYKITSLMIPTISLDITVE
ncbi:MAG: cupredoxin domain-containing protein [Candidatus ainarchaeum sp.]|nr:cupredoxin domain-containing protein [Candidatus ainarchaeum sp.]